MPVLGVHEVTGMLPIIRMICVMKPVGSTLSLGWSATYVRGRYLFDINAGYNGSENFQKGSQRFGFSSFALGWRITEEEFMEMLKLVRQPETPRFLRSGG